MLYRAFAETLEDEPGSPLTWDRMIATNLTAKRRTRVDEVLSIMADLGTIRSGQREGQQLYFARR